MLILSYESIIKERLNNDYTKPTPTNISFSEKINPDVSNRDVAKRFEEISNNRQQEYETVNSTSDMNTQPSLTNQFSENISGNQQGGLNLHNLILHQGNYLTIFLIICLTN